MTTPNGKPSERDAVAHKGFDAGDAAVQANATGGGAYTGNGERPNVRGSNQDVSSTGAADVASATSVQKAGIANKPGNTTFTK